MRVITCPICGRSFETVRSNAKYCSLSCREAGRQIKRLDWEERNPRYNSNYYHEHKERTELTQCAGIKHREERALKPEYRTTESDELRRNLDYRVGDVVQIMKGKKAGRVATIIGCSFGVNKYGEDFIYYNLKLSDTVGISKTGLDINLVRREDDPETDLERSQNTTH